MKKSPEIDGERVRQERLKRAWTQEELSERSQLAVRTLRRLEGGQGSLESLRRVSEALSVEPQQVLKEDPSPEISTVRVDFDLLTVEISSVLLGSAPEHFMEPFLARVGSIRRHLAQQMGFIMPGVRFRDFRAEDGEYRILVREKLEGQGRLQPGKHLAVGQVECLKGLGGPVVRDPTYAMPGVWLSPSEIEKARAHDCLIFSTVDVLATHLTHLVKQHAGRLVGVQAVASLLDALGQPRLVAEVVPELLSLAKLRSVLRGLLEQDVPIRDLELILDTLAEHGCPDAQVSCLVDLVRAALAYPSLPSSQAEE